MAAVIENYNMYFYVCTEYVVVVLYFPRLISNSPFAHYLAYVQSERVGNRPRDGLLACEKWLALFLHNQEAHQPRPAGWRPLRAWTI